MPEQILRKDFRDRDHLVAYVKELSPWAKGKSSPILGGVNQAQEMLENIDPLRYGKTRNYGDGKVTGLSPYIHHGVIDINQIRNHALSNFSKPELITKFIQELAWRDFWQRIAEKHPDWIWNDIEDYKTGFRAENYSEQLPEDIKAGQTGIACLDFFISELMETGYVHNHARMYLASYIVHFRRIKWQAGARWFLQHLLDGDEASNNFSWQWIASTFSNKPYIFNLDNVNKYFGSLVDTRPENNQILNASYEEIAARLFPNLGASRG